MIAVRYTYGAAERNRKIETNHEVTTRRNPAPADHAKVKATYSGNSYGSTGNPWETILRDVFGGTAVADAHAKLHGDAARRIADAPTFRDAVKEGVATVPINPWKAHGLAGEANPWSPAIVRSLVARATAQGVLDEPVASAIAPEAGYGTDLHRALLRHEGVDYGRSTFGGHTVRQRTVREFLRAIAHPDDRGLLDAGA